MQGKTNFKKPKQTKPKKGKKALDQIIMKRHVIEDGIAVFKGNFTTTPSIYLGNIKSFFSSQDSTPIQQSVQKESSLSMEGSLFSDFESLLERKRWMDDEDLHLD